MLTQGIIVRCKRTDPGLSPRLDISSGSSAKGPKVGSKSDG